MNVPLAVGATVVAGLYFSWTSRLNGLFFFGRSVRESRRTSPEGQAITRQYRRGILLATAVSLALAIAGGLHGWRLAPLGVITEGIAFALLFARANRQARQLAEQDKGEADRIVEAPLQGTPSYWIPNLGMVLLPAILAVAAIAAAIFLAGQGSGWHAGWNAWNHALDTGGLAGLLGISMGFLFAATLLLIVLRTSVRLRTRMAQYSTRASVILQWVGLALLVIVLASNSRGLVLDRHTAKGLIYVLIAFSVSIPLWNQYRSKRFVPPPVELGADDRWRWGLFYLDRNDPALFVQSRCGAGYSLNYGRRIAWPIAIVATAYLLTLLFVPMPR